MPRISVFLSILTVLPHTTMTKLTTIHSLLMTEKRAVLVTKTAQYVLGQATTSVQPASRHSLPLTKSSFCASPAAIVVMSPVRFATATATDVPVPKILTASVARTIALRKMVRWCVCQPARNKSIYRRFLTHTFACLAMFNVTAALDQMTKTVRSVQTSTIHLMMPMNAQRFAHSDPTLMVRMFARLVMNSAMVAVVRQTQTALLVLKMRWSWSQERSHVFLLVPYGRSLMLIQKDVCLQSEFICALHSFSSF